MSYLVSDEQVRMYNEVKGYSDDEVYLRMLERAYKCLKKVLICSVIFIVIGSVLSVACTGLIYRHTGSVLSDEILIGVLNLCLFVPIFVLITLLIALIGVPIAKNYMDRDELDFLNGVFKDNAICSDCDDCKIISNSNGVFFSTSGGTLVKMLNSSPEGIKIKIVSKEYYEISDACVIKRMKSYSVYDNSGKLLGYRREVQ